MPKENTSLEGSISYEAVRRALGKQFGKYTEDYKIKTTWESSHAIVGEVHLTKKRGRKKKINLSQSATCHLNRKMRYFII